MSRGQEQPLLQVRNLSISFSQYFKGTKQRVIRPITNMNIEINEGEVMAVVGASGSGKSLLAHALLGILPRNAICEGTILYQGEPLTEERKALLRGREISFIPQSVNYLDPLMPVGKQVQIGLKKNVAKTVQRRLFQQYDLQESDGSLFPHELSGGMLRRIMFATSIREEAKLVIADEPTPGIHPQALAEVLKQLKQFAEKQAGVMFITHDIISALEVADRVAVIHEGSIIEVSRAEAFEGKGEHLKTDYTRKLWRALPQNDFDLELIDGGGDK
ncbi:ATP-binding cassette domain-containing protein [Pseudogracilibacillus auburnensis]|uniref:ATP-binding cassette domain-containing protein n=1 Tax=Pseudogracilibacillus auburnensis TaxID=1494959 RepID=UPI001A95E5D7|nr:ABC transporter ATP-binding protein [Pseudogracilibacillus auburnensis]MBO1002210.1 ABC transporter ATP-binding protein [Pseudogracilibacillus auburnensis]